MATRKLHDAEVFRFTRKMASQKSLELAKVEFFARTNGSWFVEEVSHICMSLPGSRPLLLAVIHESLSFFGESF